jgi:hypothetical protein
MNDQAKGAMNGMVEIARSFSFKLSTGNYETRDFFCSQKAECLPEEASIVSKQIYDFCKREVMDAVNEYCRKHGMKEYGKKNS